MNLKIEDRGSIKGFEIVKRSLYVAVFFYPDNPVPFGATGSDKNALINHMANWAGIDKDIPIRIYTLEL